ncbi:hypothetical protein EMCG_01208 [[Emmonsia] crescens]|uniref:Uncharacterized protein n=1 Tax=[Emmonsia] crescens TaxID=73230 RepID=A0A0G2I5V7_9EURO|nr:hypothetical protein EMCG_01208 [Emmonsia crescens UAMH 3008]
MSVKNSVRQKSQWRRAASTNREHGAVEEDEAKASDNFSRVTRSLALRHCQNISLRALGCLKD